MVSDELVKVVIRAVEIIGDAMNCSKCPAASMCDEVCKGTYDNYQKYCPAILEGYLLGKLEEVSE